MDAEKPKKTFYKRWWFWAIVVIILIGIGSSGKNDVATSGASGTTSATQTPVEAIKVTASALSSAYKANEVAADAKYKDRLVEISGLVDTIGKDVMDTPYISFAGDSQYDMINLVQCMFSSSDEATLANVSKGQHIVLQGTVSGKLGNIVVKGCKIVQ